MIQRFSAVLIVLLIAGCTPPKAPEPIDSLVVRSVQSGEAVRLWNAKKGTVYEIRLACIDKAGEESQQILLSNLEAADEITFTPVGTAKAPTTPPLIHSLTAEVFVDLGDGPQSVNEAQLLAGVATLRKDANPQNCPRLEAMKQAQQDAKDSRAGIWENVK